MQKITVSKGTRIMFNNSHNYKSIINSDATSQPLAELNTATSVLSDSDCDHSDFADLSSSDFLMKVGELYAVDLPSPSSLSSEIHNWYTKWKSEEKDHGVSALPTTLSSTLPRISSFFPNIKALVTVLCTLPVTSCTAERSFSGLKRIKTALRSSMTNERLSSLSLLHIHQLTLKKSLMNSPGVIPGASNFLLFSNTPV